MAYKCGSYHLIEKTAISAGIYQYILLCPDIAQISSPGQFVHVKIDGFLLRRPISIYDIDKKNGTISIVFEIRGNGTEKLTEYRVGDNLDMMAPLGNGFTLPDKIENDRRIILVGGGIGTPPIYGLAKMYKEQTTAILGFRSYDRVILANEFKRTGAGVITCTDDGSVGEKAFVDEPLKNELAKNNTDMVYACGPIPMLKSVIKVCEDFGVPCEVSLEERMGCGVGACVCCASKVIKDGKELIQRVCKDGPVFKGNEVIL